MKIENIKRITAVWLIGAIVLVVGACSTSGKKVGNEDRVAVILDAAPGVVVMRDGKTIPAHAGFVLRKGDTLESKSGNADIQTVRGDIIRLGEFSKASMAQYAYGNNESGTEIKLGAGSLIAEVNKNESTEGFRIRTPTAIASVRGTSFLVELKDDKTPRIKVYEGAVAMAPAVAVLDEFTSEEIQQNGSLKKLTEVLEAHEIVIEEATEAEFKPEAAEIVFMINTRMKRSDFENRSGETENAEAEKLLDQQLNDLKATEMSVARPSPVTPREAADLKTIVGVDNQLVVEAVKTDLEIKADDSENSQAVATADDISKKIQDAQDANLDQALNEVAKTAESENLKTEEEIKDFYNILEVLVKKDGQKLSGAVVTQANDILIMHTTDGVKKIDRTEIDYIDFYDYDIKVKGKNSK